MLEPGTPAPDFTLLDQDGKETTLSNLKGSPVVLYFYPVEGPDFLAVAQSAPVGGSLYLVLANACEDYALTTEFFIGAVQVG